MGKTFKLINRKAYSASSGTEAASEVKKALKKGNRILIVSRVIGTIICLAILVLFVTLIAYLVIPELFNSIVNVM